MGVDGSKEAERVKGAVRVLTRVARLIENTDSGLSLAQYRMLIHLSSGGARSARVAEALRVQRPTVTALADGLIKAGLVARTSEEGDRRVVRLELTEAGAAALKRADEAYVERLAPVLADLTQRDRFLDDLFELRGVLEARAVAARAAGQK